jgi:DNA-directed RNA polymerase specialized sigma24 family protein
MPSLEQTNRQAANLYWLAFLLTGHPEESADMAADAMPAPDGDGFFSAWMLAWSRKVVISRALAAIRQELAASAQRIAAARTPRCATARPRNFSPAPAANKRELERALLAIDAFPRCVLLLLLFEGLSVDDAVVLLDADRDLVRKAQVLALQELTANLACVSIEPRPEGAVISQEASLV